MAFVRAGLEIRLDAGWHTYWRNPGDSGVPPTFDFEGSDNVKEVDVLWTAPEPFPDGAGGHSIGYMGDIIFPLHVVPEVVANGSSIHVNLAYAVCANLCIPAHANLTLELTGSGAEEAILDSAERRVPKRVLLGVGKSLATRSVHRERHDAYDRVVVEVLAPGDAPVDLFAEGPTPEWSLPLPELIGTTQSGSRRFSFDLVGLPHDAHADGAPLTLTAVSPDDAIEVITPID